MNVLEIFAHGFRDVWWLALVKVVLVVVVLLVWTIMNVWFERRVLARMMNRIGPAFNGPLGLLQTLAEGVKLLFKEDFAPGQVDKVLFNIAPFVLAISAFATWTVIPFGGEVTLFGEKTRLVAMDGPVAMLVMLAIAAVGTYGIVLAGWSSSNSYALLGSIRASAQVISYEISMGLSLVSVFLWSGSTSTHPIIEKQAEHFAPFGFDLGIPAWNAVVLIPAFVIFFISILGEIARTPFDFAECEQELVSGHITEYTGFRYALYYLGEYIHMATASALITTLFLGGYRAPWPFNLMPSIDQGWWGLLWFFVKAQIVIFVLVWIRASLPRLSYDKFMEMGWKYLIPGSLAWIVVLATIKLAQNPVYRGHPVFWIVLGAGLIGGLLWAIPWPQRAEIVEEKPFDAFAGGYPVPPLAGQLSPEAATVVEASATTMTESKEA